MLLQGHLRHIFGPKMSIGCLVWMGMRHWTWGGGDKSTPCVVSLIEAPPHAFVRCGRDVEAGITQPPVVSFFQELTLSECPIYDQGSSIREE